VREALQDAMEITIGNVPNVEGKVYVQTAVKLQTRRMPEVAAAQRAHKVNL
jgi:hypothetical protein